MIDIAPIRMTQDEFMYHYNDLSREHFNPKLFERSNEETIEMLKKVILSCERNRYFSLKVLQFRTITDYQEIHETLYEHEQARINKKEKSGKKKIENPYDYINLRDSDFILLEVTYLIKLNNGKQPKDEKDKINFERTLKVLIEVPIFVDKYYMHINGTDYAPIMQIVDRSVYNNSASGSGKKSPMVTQKTIFQPIRIYRSVVDLSTANKEQPLVQATLYTSNVYNKSMDAIKYILAKYGLYAAMEFMNIPYIHFDVKPYEGEDIYSFTTKKCGIYIMVPKYIFDNEAVVQTFVATCIRTFDRYKDTTIDKIFDPKYWVEAIGGEFNAYSIDKGIPVLDSLEDAYDLISKENLRLPDDMKDNIYKVLRWLLREFNALRGKDIYDVSQKRIRMPEYFANMYAVKLSKGLYRITGMGKNVTMDKIVGAIYTSPGFLLQVCTGYKLLDYKNMVNDNDALTALSYTYNGISGLGDQGTAKKKKQKKQRKAAVPIGFKLVQPMQVGITDMDTSSPGNPGVSGSLCPMVHVNDDGSFLDYDEPNTWEEDFREVMNNYHDLSGQMEAIEFKKKLGFDYDYIKEELVKETLNTYRELICPVIDVNGKIDYSMPPIEEFDNVEVGYDPQYGDFIQLNFYQPQQGDSQFSYVPGQLPDYTLPPTQYPYQPM